MENKSDPALTDPERESIMTAKGGLFAVRDGIAKSTDAMSALMVQTGAKGDTVGAHNAFEARKLLKQLDAAYAETHVALSALLADAALGMAILWRAGFRPRDIIEFLKRLIGDGRP